MSGFSNTDTRRRSIRHQKLRHTQELPESSCFRMFHRPITGPAVRKLPFVASVRSLWGSVTAAPYETIGLAFDVTCTLQQRSVYRVSNFAAVSATSTCRGPISSFGDLLRRRILFYLFTPPYTPYRDPVPLSEGMATRRSHNKTRLGCKECKRRRIKVSCSYEFLIGPSCKRVGYARFGASRSRYLPSATG